MSEIWACELEYLIDYQEKILNASISQEDIKAFEMPESSISDQAETEATIKIIGPLSKNGPSPLAHMLGIGGTSYNDIIKSISEISKDDNIKTVRLIMDTPGGEVNGIDEVWQAVHGLAKKKYVIAENHGLVASAGYWIASAANKIVATSPLSRTGSIGVSIIKIDTSKMDEQRGIKRVSIVSRNAPNKNPDIESKAGRESVQELADSIERIFIKRISIGRGIKEEKIIDDFGRGGILIADDPDKTKPDALSTGMIDEVIRAESVGDSDEIVAQEQRRDGFVVQTLIFSKENFTRASAVAWAKRNKFRADKVDETENSYRLRQREPGEFQRMRTIDITKGVKAVGGPLKRAARGQDNNMAPVTTTGFQQEVKAMNLSEMLAEYPDLKEEIKKKIDESFCAGVDSVEKRIKASIQFLGGDYPKPIQEMAKRVLIGETNADVLSVSVATYDMLKEQIRAEAAVEENPQDTPAQSGQETISEDGTVSNEAEFQANLIDLRERTGR